MMMMFLILFFYAVALYYNFYVHMYACMRICHVLFLFH